MKNARRNCTHKVSCCMQLACNESADTNLGPFQAKVHLTSAGLEVLHTTGTGKVISICALAMPCLSRLLGLWNVCMHALKWLSALCNLHRELDFWSEGHPVIAYMPHIESFLMLSHVRNECHRHGSTCLLFEFTGHQCGHETRNWACMHFWDLDCINLCGIRYQHVC